MTYIYKQQIMSTKEVKSPYRSQSLNLKKSLNTVELPRFFSKPKNQVISHTESRKNNFIKIIKARPKKIQQIIKQSTAQKSKQQYTNSKDHKQTQSTPKKKNQFAIRQSVKKIDKIQQKGAIIKFTTYKKSNKFVSTEPQEPGDTKAIAKKNIFKSKNVKMPIQTKNSLENEYLRSKKLITNSTNQRRQKSKSQNKNQLSSAYQGQQKLEQSQLQLWKKVQQILRAIAITVTDVGPIESYINSQHFRMQKKIFYLLPSTKHRNKFKSHLAMTRVVIYIYIYFILNGIDPRTVLLLMEKLYDSYKIIGQSLRKDINKNQDWVHSVGRNNEQIFKTLQIILGGKKKLSHGDLFKNLLQSCLKIQSIEFLEVIDKTLKWQILKMPSYPYLPASQKTHYLVLDLDETLVHYKQATQTFHVRPFVQSFIQKISQHYQITIFTAATQEYADQILNEIDRTNSISHRLYRNHLTFQNQFAVKDLSLLGRPLNRTIIVDNLSNNFRMQPANGILINSWFGDQNDEILKKLYQFLIKLLEKYPEDVRIGISEHQKFIKDEIALSEIIYSLKAQL